MWKYLSCKITLRIKIKVLFLLLMSQWVQGQADIYPSPIKKAKFQLPPNYDKEMRPAPFGGVVNVEYDIHVQAINPIKASDMDFRMEMLLSQQWVDLRLNFTSNVFFDNDFIILPFEFIDMIWHPDPYIVNAKSTDVGSLTQKLIKVYIFKNHTVAYSVNMFVTVACSMQFHYYPFDFQICPMIMESFSYDETKVKYTWSKSEAFTINPKLRLLQFQVTYPLMYDELSIPRVKADKNYSQLIAYFRFDRLLGNHLIQTFSPCCLIVALSWFSFWLELDAISARVSLLVTSMLTLVTQFSGLKAEFPPVAYLRAVDIWMAGCLIFVFGALGEFIIIKVIYVLTEDARAKMSPTPEEPTELEITEPQEPTETSTALPSPSASTPITTKGQTQRSRFVFPPADVRAAVQSPVSKVCPIEASTPIIYQTKRLGSLKMKREDTMDGSDNVRVVVWKRFDIGLPLVWTNPKTKIRQTLWKTIDDYSKWGFPITFCIFLFVYWLYLFIHSRLHLPGEKIRI